MEVHLLYSEIIVRLGLAMLAGVILGLNRWMHHKSAGIRTHTLVSVGSALGLLLMSSINVCLFFGGWLPFFGYSLFLPSSFWFGIKICFFVILFIFMRAALPRYRYDQLMGLGWKVFVPIALVSFLFIAIILVSFQLQPF